MIGPPMSFKNKKRIGFNRKTGKGVSYTDKKTKQWMQNAIAQLESQLLTCCPTIAGETAGEWRKRLLTVLFPLQDDSWKYMLPGAQNVKMVPKGKEGVEIEIEKL